MDKRESDIWKWAISAILGIVLSVTGCDVINEVPYDGDLEIKKVEKQMLDSQNNHTERLLKIEAQKELKMKLIEKGATIKTNADVDRIQ